MKSFINQRLEKGRKKPYEREADDANGDIRGLDAAIEQHPVETQQSPTATKLQKLSPAHTRQSCKDQQDEARKQHPIPYDIHLIQCDESPEEASKACKQHAQMQLYESLSRLRHQTAISLSRHSVRYP